MTHGPWGTFDRRSTIPETLFNPRAIIRISDRPMPVPVDGESATVTSGGRTSTTEPEPLANDTTTPSLSPAIVVAVTEVAAEEDRGVDTSLLALRGATGLGLALAAAVWRGRRPRRL